MKTMDRLADLKNQLSAEIQKENSDNNKILYLSNEIAKLDESEVRFSVDAGIINRLGIELVGKHETAVSELVKNAYDADASEVKLIFDNARDKGGTLRIKDNGVGMDREQLINGFMRLSSSAKVHQPRSTKYKRVRAGRKGIGRFATQRLGKTLIIVTQTLKSKKALRLIINWDRFEIDKELSSITSFVEEVDKIKEEGTDLIIQDLREGWSDAMIERVYRYTSELLQPFPLSKKMEELNEDEIDPGFSTSYYRRENDQLNKIVDEEEAFLKHALAEIEGYVLDDGQGYWSLKSNKLNFPEEVFLIGKNRDIPDSKFDYISGIHFKCYYFVFEPSLLPPKTLSFIKTVANEKGGIRLYRNGFRVLPYGEKGNDWIRLDESSRRNTYIASHRNNNFFGFVEVAGESSAMFEETSSREGVIENEAFYELTDFVYRCIISAVLKVAELRGRKSTTSQKNWKADDLNPAEKVDAAISKLKDFFESDIEKNAYNGRNEADSDNDSGHAREGFKSALESLVEGIEDVKREKDMLIEENNMLRVLAGLGLVIGEFVHEIKRFLPSFDVDIRYLKTLLKASNESIDRVSRLEANVKSFTTYTSYFDRAISRNVLRDLEPIELRDVVNDFIDVIQQDLKRSRITLLPPVYNDFDLFTVPMHPSEWSSILFNFYTNSKKAIRRRDVDGIIFIKCGRESGGNLFLEFSDNGDGIPPQNEEEIFNAFFTTSSAASLQTTDSEALTSTGLGLKIVKDTIESYGGKVYVTTPEEGFSSTMRIEVPQNK